MDELLLGPAEDDASHLYQLRELDIGWHLGADDLPSWRQAILSEVPNLFSIGRDPSQVCWIIVVRHDWVKKEKCRICVTRIVAHNRL